MRFLNWIRAPLQSGTSEEESDHTTTDDTQSNTMSTDPTEPSEPAQPPADEPVAEEPVDTTPEPTPQTYHMTVRRLNGEDVTYRDVIAHDANATAEDGSPALVLDRAGEGSATYYLNSIDGYDRSPPEADEDHDEDAGRPDAPETPEKDDEDGGRRGPPAGRGRGRSGR